MPTGIALQTIFGELKITVSRVLDLEEGRFTEARGHFQAQFNLNVKRGMAARMEQLSTGHETWWMIDGIVPTPRSYEMELHLAERGWSLNRVTD